MFKILSKFFKNKSNIEARKIRDVVDNIKIKIKCRYVF